MQRVFSQKIGICTVQDHEIGPGMYEGKKKISTEGRGYFLSFFVSITVYFVLASSVQHSG